MRKYQELVRPNAPWCPTNIEFIRRINGLDRTTTVQRHRLRCSYLVLGLGDVYLGAPVATPVDPRHRLVTTKYNPARTWTPENAVGIGGAYMCIYGMEGPGGYQLFGRTIQMWNTWRTTPAFEPGKPWLLRLLRPDPLLSGRRATSCWKRAPPSRTAAIPCEIEEGSFSCADYHSDLDAQCGRDRRLQDAPAGGLRGRAPALEGAGLDSRRRRRCCRRPLAGRPVPAGMRGGRRAGARQCLEDRWSSRASCRRRPSRGHHRDP